MVDAGRVLFQVGIDRPSVDRAVADLERRLSTVGDIDLKLGDAAATASIRQLEALLSSVQSPALDLKIDTIQAQQSVRRVGDALDSVESAIAAISNRQAQVNVDVARGEASIARLEAQIQGLQDKRVQIDANAQAAEAKLRAIDAQLVELGQKREELSVGVDDTATVELTRLDARIERLNAQRLRVQATVDNVEPEIAKVETRLNELNARKITVEADTTAARAQLSQLDRTLGELNSDNAQEALNRLQRELRETGDAANDAGGQTNSFNAVLSGLAGGAAVAVVDRLVDAFGQLTSAITGFIAASIQANAELRNTENALTILLGSQEAAADSIQFLRETSELTGQSFSALQNEYAGITAAAAEFGLPQEEVNALFAETSRVLGIFGKSSAESGLAFNALTQIFSKGQVSLEELRGQLGEQLPVALTATANGLQELGILTNGTTSELLDLVSSGLDAATFAQGFTLGLQQIGGAAPAAQQALASLDNAVLEFQQNLGASLEPLETAFAETFAAIFGGIDVSALDPLTEAGNRLRDALADSPELAERLGDALTNFLGSGAEAVAGLLDRLTDALSDPGNVERFAQSIENAGELLEILVRSVGVTIEAVVGLGAAFNAFLPSDVIIGSLNALVSVLELIVDAAGLAAESISDLNSRLDELGLIPGLEDFGQSLPGIGDQAAQIGAAADNVSRYGLAIGLTKSAVDAFNGAKLEIEVAETDFSGLVPQRDELDKSVRAARDSNDQIAADAERAAKRAAQERAKADQEAAKAFEKAQKDALANIEIAQQNRISAVRQNQASGLISEEDANAQVADIQSDAIQERIRLREQEIAQVEDFASRQAISEEDAAERVRAAREAIADLTLESIETEIRAQDEARRAAEEKAEAARDAVLEQLDAQQQLNGLQAEQVSIQSNLASTALQDQANLIGAQVGLEESRLALSRQTLEAKLREAQANEDALAIEDARDSILLNQRRSIQVEFNARRQQLQIQQQLNRLDADRQLRLAEIAEAESRIAIERARVEGSSQSEIQKLTEIARLREAETEASQFQANSRQNIFDIQLQQLSVDEEIANQRATQERREQAIESFRQQQRDLADEQLQTERELAQATEQRARAADQIVSALSGLEDVAGEDALASLDQLEENLRSVRRAGFGGQDASRLQQAIDQAQSFARSGGEFSIDEAFRFAQQDNPFAGGVLDAVGLGGVSSFLDAQQEIALADSQISELTGKLTEVKEAIENIEFPPSVGELNVTTANPVSDAGNILADLNRQRREALGVS